MTASDARRAEARGSGFFTKHLKDADPEVWGAIEHEAERQQNEIAVRVLKEIRDRLRNSDLLPAELFAIQTWQDKQGPLLASLGQGDQSALLPFWAMVGPIMFFAIGCAIFTMGAAWSMRVAFSFSPAAQQLFGKIGGALGVTEKTGFGIQTISRRLGIEQNVQAARERIAQTGGDITAGLRGRYPGLFSSQEEALAAARQRMGVRAGLGDMEKLSAPRVSTERSNIEAYLKRQQAAAAANLEPDEERANTCIARQENPYDERHGAFERDRSRRRSRPGHREQQRHLAQTPALHRQATH